jgi:hypothetical protein
MKPVKVEVRDSKNKDRVLGSIINPPTKRGRYMRFPVMERLPSMIPPADPMEMLDIKSVDLEIDWRVEDSGYTQRAVFLTDAPLDRLMMMSNFRLPGETEEGAHIRRRYA